MKARPLITPIMHRCLNLECTTVATYALFLLPLISAPFTSGSLVVERIGDGSAALSSSSTPVFLQEFSTAGGAALQTISLPNATPRPSANPFNLTDTGSGTSAGHLIRSTSGLILSVPGYNGITGDASISTSSGSTISRTIGVVNNAATVDTSRSLNILSSQNFRSVVSADGATFWAGGGNGIYFVTGVPGSGTLLNSANTRVVRIFNSQLYFSTGSSPQGIYSLGTGLPTSAGQTATQIISVGGSGTPSPYGFEINAAGTIAYVADDRSFAGGGGILKYTFSGGTWTFAYALGSNSVRGLTINWSGANAILYATTTETSANRLIAVTDTGSDAAPTTLATAAANTVFRGVAFSPVAALGITCPPAASGLQCVSAISAAATTSATFISAGGTITGGCAPYSISHSDSTASGGCPNRLTLTRTYTVADSCGNTATCMQTNIVNDVTAPSFTGCPSAPVNLGCNPTRPTCSTALALVSASDNCDGSITPSCSASDLFENGCRFGQAFTLIATDACSLSSTCTVTFVWTEDRTAPVFDGCPSSPIDLGCNPTTLATCDDALALVTVIETCSAVTPTCSAGQIQTSGCRRTQTFTLSATDECTNSSSCQITYAWTVDSDPPVFTVCPANLTNECGASIVFGAPSTSDTCSSVTISSVTITNLTCGNTFVATRTWTARDACGNSQTCSQTIATVDTTPPVISCAASKTNECNVGSLVFDTPTASDTCGNVTVSILSTVTNATCGRGFVATRAWKVIDACGSTNTCAQTIASADMTPPRLSPCPADTNVCLGEPIAFTPPTATDDCDGALTVICVRNDGELLNGPFRVGTTTISCSSTDACGNFAICSFRVTVRDCTQTDLPMFSYSQGFWGNAGNQKKPKLEKLALMDQLLGSGLTVGKPGQSLTMRSGDAVCLVRRLPAGGPPSALPAGDHAFSGDENCVVGLPLDHKETKFRNALLGQTISLALNVRISDPCASRLGGFELQTNFCTVAAEKDTTAGCYKPGAKTTCRTSTVAAKILQALAVENLPTTVDGLLELANRGLAGLRTGGASLGEINEAVDAINNAFDECRFVSECEQCSP